MSFVNTQWRDESVFFLSVLSFIWNGKMLKKVTFNWKFYVNLMVLLLILRPSGSIHHIPTFPLPCHSHPHSSILFHFQTFFSVSTENSKLEYNNFTKWEILSIIFEFIALILFISHSSIHLQCIIYFVNALELQMNATSQSVRQSVPACNRSSPSYYRIYDALQLEKLSNKLIKFWLLRLFLQLPQLLLSTVAGLFTFQFL